MSALLIALMGGLVSAPSVSASPALAAGAPESAPATPDLHALERCKDHVISRIFYTPRHPHKRAPMRLMPVSEVDVPGARLTATDPEGRSFELPMSPYGLGPWGWVAEVDKPIAGNWRVALWSGDEVVVCKKVRVRRSPARPEPLVPEEDQVWHSRWKWERDAENFYALFVEHLFSAPPDEDVSWNPLSELLQDRSLNLLHDHFQSEEDSKDKELGLRLRPDCADFPYTLRAYFAWKNGLPMGFRRCRRGSAKRAPTCGDLQTNLHKAEYEDPVQSFERFARKKVAGTVHSSSPRTLGSDESTDLYAVELDRHALRPGAVYADPYGHVMVVAKWFPPTEARAGVLMAADAQPDGTIGRRHFWKGSFIFPDDGTVSGGGFKRFRPVYRDTGGMHAMTNAEIAASEEYGDFSLEQWEAGKVAFYDRMDELINPEPMDPKKAFVGTLDALDQQLRRRVESVDNGEGWKRKHKRKVMDMPEGASIFLTSGPWEDFSTPARDLRLLVAVDTVLDFPSKVARLPHRFVLGPGETPAQAGEVLERVLAEEAAGRSYTYRRSDGSEWTLTMADVLARRAEIELSWNPNDCVEHRWFARPEANAEEYATCTSHAPDEQRKKMLEYQHWFSERRRPAR